MEMLKKFEKEMNEIIKLALKEDIGAGDITTDVLISQSAETKAVFVAKDHGIICGLPVAKRVFQVLDKNIKVTYKKKDGAWVKPGEIMATVKGRARALLSGERLALNIMQRLSGIATYTNKYVEIAKPYGVKILDTRKTTPLMRLLEKYAVKTGGGVNHRMGLYDAVLIKNNHLKQINIEKAYVDMRRWIPKDMKVEIEVETIEMLEKVIKLQPDIIMLDNMNVEMLHRAIPMVRKSGIPSKIEVSGGINMSNIRDVVKTRPDFVSIGSITHSPPSMDISLRMIS